MSGPRLVAVGDLMLGDSATCVGFGFRSRVGHDALAEHLRRFAPLQGADLAFGNLECSLSDVGWNRHDWRRAQMRGRPAYGPVLAEAGFAVLNVANNHAHQHGPVPFEATVRQLRGAGIQPCGLRGTAPWCSQPLRIEVRGVPLGVLGYCLRPRQFGEGPPPYAEGSPDEIAADVARLVAEGRSVIVSLHWGEEFATWPSREEVSAARAMVDAGAMIVLGHHPHVARPVERYRGALIAYSLGNFAADMIWYEPMRRGLTVGCRVGAGGLESLALHAHRIGDYYLPEPTPEAIVPDEGLVGMDESSYAAAVAETLGRQRAALYVYTIRNWWRFSPAILAAMVGRTMWNKLTSLADRRHPHTS